MKLFLIILITALSVSCSYPGRYHNYVSDTNLFGYLKDSINFFDKVYESDIVGIIEDSVMRIVFESVPKNEFFEAIKRNEKNVRYFTSKGKLNEATDRINKTTLRVGDDGNYMYLCDIAENKQHRARNFFLNNKIGDHYIVQRIQFEDAETILWNSKTGNEDLFLYGLSVCSREKDSLIFYTRYPLVTPKDETPVCFLKIMSNKIDTIFYKYENWHADLAFFDNERNTLYYIHNFSENDEIKSTYAKLDFEIKN